MLDLLIAGDAVRKKTREGLATEPEKTTSRTPVRPRRHRVRATSASALRSLAAVIEPSPTPSPGR